MLGMHLRERSKILRELSCVIELLDVRSRWHFWPGNTDIMCSRSHVPKTNHVYIHQFTDQLYIFLSQLYAYANTAMRMYFQIDIYKDLDRESLRPFLSRI